jgi:serine/threonine protein kinase
VSADEGDTPVQTLVLRSGALVDSRYRILRPLGGSSAYALTYLAQDEQAQELVVLKEFLPRSLARRDGETVRPHTAADAQELARAAKRFLREGEILADLSHAALPRMQAAFPANGTAYLAITHYDAIPLPQHLSVIPDERLSSARAVELILPILDALELLHAEGVIHRDISPQTVFVDTGRGGQPILLSWPAHRHLGGGTRHLAPGFAALEQYGNRGLGPWTDVHGCAALLYYLVTGVTPPSAVDRAAAQTLSPPSAYVPAIPSALSSAILRAMAQVPEQRPHSVSELRRVIAAPATSTPSQLSPAVSPTGPQSLGEFLASDRFNAGATPAAEQAQRPFDFEEISATLKFAAGVVVPEERGLVDRFRSWIDARRAQRSERPRPFETTIAESPATVARRQVLEEFTVTHPSESSALVVPEPAPVPSPSGFSTTDSRQSSDDQRPMTARPGRDVTAAPGSVPGAALATVDDEQGSIEVPARRLPRLQLAPRASHGRTRVAATIGVVVLIGIVAGGAAYAYRGQNPLSFGRRAPDASPSAGTPAIVTPSAATQPVRNPPVVVLAATDSAPSRVLSEASGAVQQGASTPANERSARERRQENARRQAGDAPATTIPNVANVAVPIAQPEASALLPAEVDVDLRDRLASGRELIDVGQYAAARRVFRSSIERIDSLASRYSGSTALRTMRENFDRESRRALDACTAENALRTKRGGTALPCG